LKAIGIGFSAVKGVNDMICSLKRLEEGLPIPGVIIISAG
jgi:hypothetical protein